MISRVESKKKSSLSFKTSAPLSVWLIVWLVVALLTGFAVWGLSQNPLYATKSFWLVSRAAAVASYLMLTVTVILGLLLSHPRNKDTWQSSKLMLPWHQAILPVFISLLTTHLLFTVLDAKSGVLPINILSPLSAHYRPYAMLFGSLGLGMLVIVLLTSLWPGVFRSTWLKIHRIAPIIWVAVWIHGMFAGTDAFNLYDMYLFTGIFVIGVLMWRYWVKPLRAAKKVPLQDK